MLRDENRRLQQRTRRDPHRRSLDSLAETHPVFNTSESIPETEDSDEQESLIQQLQDRLQQVQLELEEAQDLVAEANATAEVFEQEISRSEALNKAQLLEIQALQDLVLELRGSLAETCDHLDNRTRYEQEEAARLAKIHQELEQLRAEVMLSCSAQNPPEDFAGQYV